MLVNRQLLKRNAAIKEDRAYMVFEDWNTDSHIRTIRIFQDRISICGAVISNTETESTNIITVDIEYNSEFKSNVRSTAKSMLEWKTMYYKFVFLENARFMRKGNLLERLFGSNRKYSIDDIISLVVSSYDPSTESKEIPPAPPGPRR